MIRLTRFLWRVAVLALLLTAIFGNRIALAESTLERVIKQGSFKCGVSGVKPGLALIDSKGNWSGFDVDICRAVGAALFDDPGKVELVPTTWAQVFVALQTGTVDIMNRGATFTISRDNTIGADFIPMLYSGQGFMVRKDMGVTSLDDLEGATFCVLAGTTTEANIVEYFRRRNKKVEIMGFDSYEVIYPAYEKGRCDVVSTEPPSLAGQRVKFKNPGDYVILEQIISKEPMGPMVRHGDNQWADIVRTTMFALIAAEEFGITSKNVFDMVKAAKAGNVKQGDAVRLLGVEGNLGSKIGLTDDFAVRVIKHVGNYGEIWERNFGQNSATPLPRGQNKLYTEGGLLYAPPFRSGCRSGVAGSPIREPRHS